MKTRFILCCLILFHSIVLLAENYPYRSDVLWVTEPDHCDWIYHTGEQAKIEVRLYQYGMPQDGIKVNYELADDLMPADSHGSVTLQNGRAFIKAGTMKKPGFRDCRLTAHLQGKTYRHHIKVGFSPEQIRPYTQKPDDFETFWEENMKEAAAFPLSYTMSPVKELCTEKADCYLVKLQLNRKGQAIYGYLFRPKGATSKSCPVVLCPPGAGIKTIKNPLRHAFYAEQGFIRFEFEIHGLNPTWSEEMFQEISRAFNGAENGYLTYGLDNRDNYYMKRVYLACIRCIDFLTALPEWDEKNVIVQGASQGGALALVTAALDKRVTLCAASHPALSDMAAYRAGRADGYPHFSKIKGMDTPEKRKTMAYYDVVNFARQVTVPVFLTWGFNDNTCPPTTSYAVYNTLACPKETLITPVNEHWTSDETERAILKWIEKNLQ